MKSTQVKPVMKARERRLRSYQWLHIDVAGFECCNQSHRLLLCGHRPILASQTRRDGSQETGMQMPRLQHRLLANRRSDSPSVRQQVPCQASEACWTATAADRQSLARQLRTISRSAGSGCCRASCGHATVSACSSSRISACAQPSARQPPS